MYYDEGDQGEEDEEEDLLFDDVDDTLGGLFFEDDGAGVDTAGEHWAERALTEAQTVLGGSKFVEKGITLFALKAVPSAKRLEIRLDKLNDQFGSPTLDEMEEFAREFNAKFEVAVGEEEAGSVELEVSSPGAERVVSVPEELDRFKEIPMKVEFMIDENRTDVRVFNIVTWDTQNTTWALADTKQHKRENKGRPLTRKQRDLRFDVPLDTIKKVKLYLDA